MRKDIYNNIYEYELSKYLLLFINYGDEKVIKRVLNFFIIKNADKKFDNDIRLLLFNAILNAEANQSVKSFINFFECILKSITFFKFKKSGNKSLGNFLSEIINYVLDTKIIYEIIPTGIVSRCLVHHILLEHDNIIIKKSSITIGRVNNEHKFIVSDRIIDYSNFMNYSKQTRSRDFLRYKEVQDKLNKIFNKESTQYCPICNPFGNKSCNVPQCCNKCKYAFELVENNLGKQFKKNLYDSIKAVKTQNVELKVIQQKRFEALKRSLERKCSKQNVTISSKIKKEICKAFKDSFWLIT